MKGILFIDFLLSKVVKGEKTMTRRTGGLKGINSETHLKIDHWFEVMRVDSWSDYVDSILRDKFKKKKGIHFVFFGNAIAAVVKPRYQPGEIVYLKESCGRVSGIMFYRVDYPEGHKMRTDFKGWGNKLFMKAENARFKVQITDVRVERANDITEEDSIKEGCANKAEFETIWMKINGISSWKKNPYVFVYSFKRV